MQSSALVSRRAPHPYAQTRANLESISGLIDEAFSIAKARITFREVNGAVECRCFIPDAVQVQGKAARPLIITARVGLPTETEIGAVLERNYVQRYGTEVGAGKARKKLKKAVKKVAAKTKQAAHKVAKSKVFKALKKIAVPLAAVVPGMQPLAAGLVAAQIAKKAVHAAKKGHPKAHGVIAKVAHNLKRINTQTKRALSAPKPVTEYTVTDEDGNAASVTL
jgi:hypothetical protein